MISAEGESYYACTNNIYVHMCPIIEGVTLHLAVNVHGILLLLLNSRQAKCVYHGIMSSQLFLQSS